MRGVMMRVVLVGAAMALLAGCASTGNKQIMDAGFMDSLKIGATTKDEVKALLGEPQDIDHQVGYMETWRYMGTEKSINAACLIPLLDIAAGRQTTRARVVDIYFEPNGIIGDIKVQSELSESIMPIGTLMMVGAAAGAGAATAARPYGYYRQPGKMVINTIPTRGGGSMSTIKWYR